MKTIEQILRDRQATPEEVIAAFDSLPPTSTAFMLGRWKGYEITTGHAMEGLLEPSGWYGKLFIDAERVHPLLFYAKSKSELYAVDPKRIPLTLNFPRIKALGVIMRLLRPFWQTKHGRARIRMVANRGKVTGTMVYDHKAIMDHFVKVDENTMLGIMDLKGNPAPYAFVLVRDNDASYRIAL